eukprot:gene30979-40309_t
MSEQYTVLYLIFSDAKIGLWSFLQLTDILHLSISSRFGASLMIPPYSIQDIIKKSGYSQIQRLSHFNIRFPVDLSIGMLRRVLHRVTTGTEAVVSVDSTTGRIVMDIGSAFSRDVYLAAHVTAVPYDEDEEFPESEQIQKQFEICSYDEYDDFKPRHPLPKNHRRGNSYFNSDVEAYANDAIVGFDMSNIAAAATALNVEEVDPNSIKNKFLSRKKSTLAFEHTHVTTNKFPGKTKSFHERTSAGVTSTESDEER